MQTHVCVYGYVYGCVCMDVCVCVCVCVDMCMGVCVWGYVYGYVYGGSVWICVWAYVYGGMCMDMYGRMCMDVYGGMCIGVWCMCRRQVFHDAMCPDFRISIVRHSMATRNLRGWPFIRHHPVLYLPHIGIADGVPSVRTCANNPFYCLDKSFPMVHDTCPAHVCRHGYTDG